MRRTESGKIWKASACIILALSFLLGGCSKAPRGRLVREGTVALQFKEAKILPGYTYYYYGRASSPIAIIALKQDLELVSRLWSPLDQSKRSLAYLVEATKYQRNDMCTFYGAVILKPDGEVAGFWYSKWEMTSIRTPEPGKIEVFPPAEPSYGPCKPEGYYRK